MKKVSFQKDIMSLFKVVKFSTSKGRYKFDLPYMDRIHTLIIRNLHRINKINTQHKNETN